MAILTVSREFMSGAEEIAKDVASELGYEYIDKDVILEHIKTAGKRWEKVGEDFDESAPSIWESFDWAYRGFIALVEAEIYENACKNNVVIMGRGADILLNNVVHVLKVGIAAPIELRVKNVMSMEHIDKQMAEWLVVKADKSRAGYVQRNYGKKWYDAKRFDILLNMGTQSKEQAKQAIIVALHDKDLLFTDEVKKDLEQQALAARIEAKVLTHPGMHVPTFEVIHIGDEIILRGVVSVKEHHLIEDLAKDLAGPVPIKSEFHYRG